MTCSYYIDYVDMGAGAWGFCEFVCMIVKGLFASLADFVICIAFFMFVYFFFFQAEDGIRDGHVTGVQTCAFRSPRGRAARGARRGRTAARVDDRAGAGSPDLGTLRGAARHLA